MKVSLTFTKYLDILWISIKIYQYLIKFNLPLSTFVQHTPSLGKTQFIPTTLSFNLLFSWQQLKHHPSDNPWVFQFNLVTNRKPSPHPFAIQ